MEEKSKVKKIPVGIKADPAVIALVHEAAEKHNISYIDIWEQGAKRLAKSLMKQPALKGLGGPQ